MDEWKKYARARDQIYHYKVSVRAMHEDIPTPHRTPQLVRLMEMVDALVSEAALCFENGEVLAMQLDRYGEIPLPGFEGLDEELKKPHWDGEA